MGLTILSENHRRELEEGSGIHPEIVKARGYYTATEPKQLLELGFSKEQSKLIPCLVVPTWFGGEIVNHQIKPDKPRLRDGKPIKYESPAGSSPRIDVPPMAQKWVKDHSKDLFITEGIKKADAALNYDQCCIALSGVWLFRDQFTALADWDSIAIKKRRIYIAFDSDVMVKPEVQKALRRLAAFLKSRGAAEVIPLVFAIPGFTGKLGFDDYFVNGGTVFGIRNCANLELISGRQIKVNNRSLADVSSDALNAISESNTPPETFIRGGQIVRVVTDERHVSKIQNMTPAMVRGLLARSATWFRKTKDGETEVSPPMEVVEDVMALAAWPDIPPVVAVTRAPVLAKDGTLSTSPGYCPASNFYIAGKDEWPEWKGTTEDAVSYLFDEVLIDFPFASEADRAHAVALMLLPIVRPVISGPTPLHLIDAPVQGSGKSLLARVCLMVTVGSGITATPGTRDEEEWRKKITSCLMDGRSYVFFDNLSRKIDSEALAGVLTATDFGDRVLGKSENATFPVRCTWVATTNNAELSRDILRRSLWIRIDPGVERPEDRRGFRHPRIESWVAENRPTIISALCHIVRGWVEAGMPSAGKLTDKDSGMIGSYEEWCWTLGGILKYCNIPGFLGNLEQLRNTADTDHGAWVAFAQSWYQRHLDGAMKAGDVLDLFEEEEELAAMLGNGNESSRKTRLGHLLRKKGGVVLGDFRIERTSWKSGGTSRYKVVENTSQTPPFGSKPHLNPTLVDQVQKGGVCGVCGVLFVPPTYACACAPDRARTQSQNPTKPLKPHHDGDDLNLNGRVGFSNPAIPDPSIPEVDI